RERLESSIRDAEARALRAQMDPHFLFNALNSVRALIDYDPDGARDMLTRYTEVLHYALTTGRAASVALGDELRAVESYLDLERRRYEDRMTVHIDVPVAHQGVRIPPLLLQTLAENAVRHGIARMRSGGSVAIATEQRESSLILSVMNPAPMSLDDEKSRELGIGLSNSRERLTMLYGTAAALHVDRQADDLRTMERWTVRVTLPLTLPQRSAAVE
uniref:sensor histidine kinase n=1 Tax=Gemmatimonas sp. TaxID=1962908 RepID=UPI00333F7F86